MSRRVIEPREYSRSIGRQSMIIGCGCAGRRPSMIGCDVRIGSRHHLVATASCDERRNQQQSD
jgi:hypothetical protein